MAKPCRIAVVTACLLAASAAGRAQPARPPTPAPAPAPAAAAAMPQQTTATFGDWVLRCTRTTAPGQVCELVETVSREERPVAQVAVGHVNHTRPLHLTVLVPANVTLGTAPTLASAHDGEPPLAELAWRRCLPAGCLAEATLSDDAAKRMRGLTEPGRLQYLDGAGRPVTLPLSPAGLPPALDALAKEDGV